MRILFTVIPEKGHINPYIPVAQALQMRGHTVAFQAAADISAQLHRAGLDKFLGSASQLEHPAASRGKFFAERIMDQEWLRQWIKTLLIEKVPDSVEPLRATVRDFAPDIFVTDPMLYGSVIVAEQEKLPWAALSNSLNPVLNETIQSELLRTVKWLELSRIRLFAAHGISGIKFRGCDALSPHLTACFTTKEFVGYDVPGVHMVGPARMLRERGDEVEFPWDRLSLSKRRVFASFGSQIYFQPRRFNTIIEAFRHDNEVQLILSVGELIDTHELRDLPEDAIVMRYVPQLKLLPKVHAFITHGGANSVMEALASGVRIVISPICNDQFHQAWFIKNAGVGAEAELSEATPAQVNSLVHAVLNDRSIQSAISKVSGSYEVDGAARAAELIEGLV